VETILHCEGREMGLGIEKSANMRTSKPTRKGIERKKRKGKTIARTHRSTTNTTPFFLGGSCSWEWEWESEGSMNLERARPCRKKSGVNAGHRWSEPFNRWSEERGFGWNRTTGTRYL